MLVNPLHSRRRREPCVNEIYIMAMHKITCCSLVRYHNWSHSLFQKKREMQEMMVHETAQSCYLINRFSQLLKLERMKSGGGKESLLLALHLFLKAAAKKQPEMKNDWVH